MSENLNDIISSVKNESESEFSHLCEMYSGLLNSMVLSFSAGKTDVENDDLMQEAIMALYSAAKNYDLTQDCVTFGLYAKVCIKNRLISFRRKHKRNRKHVDSVNSSLHTEQRILDNENNEELSKAICSILSPNEKKVFFLYIEGCSYKEIATRLHRELKSVDNAVYRIRRKLKNLYDI